MAATTVFTLPDYAASAVGENWSVLCFVCVPLGFGLPSTMSDEF
jgi:hypothetical protein